jgi:hypothetical protein
MEAGRAEKTPMIIVDSKSVRNTDIAVERGYEAGKNFQWLEDFPPKLAAFRFFIIYLFFPPFSARIKKR